jgi:hypothetical protein
MASSWQGSSQSISLIAIYLELCRSSGDWAPNSHRGDSSSSSGKVLWDLWWRDTGVGLLLVLRFPLKFIPLIVPRSPPSIIQDWYNRPINGRSNNEFGFTLASYVNKQKIVVCSEFQTSIVTFTRPSYPQPGEFSRQPQLWLLYWMFPLHHLQQTHRHECVVRTPPSERSPSYKDTNK